MAFEVDYLKLLRRIGNFTKEVSGVSIIDAYFGPIKLSPEIEKRHLSPDILLMDLDNLIGKAKEIDDELKRLAITGDLESLRAVVKWLSVENIPYRRLVEEIFGITPRKFNQKEINRGRQIVNDACAILPGSDVAEKVRKWEEENEITGKALEKMINTEIVERTQEIKVLYERRILNYIPTKVENKGVIYETVTGEPWISYNYYKGDYTSINAFNIDLPFNRYRLIQGLCHEYEHHVSNLFIEKYYRENKALDLSVILLLTKRSAISEASAECAKDFLGLKIGEYAEFMESLSNLQWMVNLNAAYMLNVEYADEQTIVEYMFSEGMELIREAMKWIEFSRPLTSDDKPNFFKPYIHTYFFGKNDYIYPTFLKAHEKGKLKEFFQTLYLNPYSRSTSTWKKAFSMI